MALESFRDKDVQEEIALRDKLIAELENRCLDWERWYDGILNDFVGLTTDRSNPGRTHDWDWIDQWRPAPKHINPTE